MPRRGCGGHAIGAVDGDGAAEPCHRELCPWHEQRAPFGWRRRQDDVRSRRRPALPPAAICGYGQREIRIPATCKTVGRATPPRASIMCVQSVASRRRKLGLAGRGEPGATRSLHVDQIRPAVARRGPTNWSAKAQAVDDEPSPSAWEIWQRPAATARRTARSRLLRGRRSWCPSSFSLPVSTVPAKTGPGCSEAPSRTVTLSLRRLGASPRLPVGMTPASPRLRPPSGAMGARSRVPPRRAHERGTGDRHDTRTVEAGWRRPPTRHRPWADLDRFRCPGAHRCG